MEGLLSNHCNQATKAWKRYGCSRDDEHWLRSVVETKWQKIWNQRRDFPLHHKRRSPAYKKNKTSRSLHRGAHLGSYASYIYKWKSWSLEVTTDSGILVVADELAVKFDANLNALPPLEMVNTDQRFVENHVDKNCSKSERPMKTTINGEDSIHSQQTDALEPTQIRQLAASIDQTRSNIAKAEQDLRERQCHVGADERRWRSFGRCA